MIPSTRATITAVAAAVIAVTGYLGTRYLAAGVLACIIATAIGYPNLMRVTRPRVTTSIIIGGGLLALVAVVLGRTAPYLRYMTVAVAAVTIAVPRGRGVLPHQAWSRRHVCVRDRSRRRHRRLWGRVGGRCAHQRRRGPRGVRGRRARRCRDRVRPDHPPHRQHRLARSCSAPSRAA